MKLFDEFKAFIARGNVLELATAVVIGAAFGKIVTAMVDGIVMPAIGAATGGVSVSDWKYVIEPATRDAKEVAILYGAFLQTVVDFLIIAAVIFLVLKLYSRIRKAPDPVEAVTPDEVVLLREIRDLLKAQAHDADRSDTRGEATRGD